jgi:hypothetical protein
MSLEHLPQYIATNNIKPTIKGGGGGGGRRSPIDQLKAVLCDPTGKCCIDGSDEDRAIIDRALQALTQPEQEPVAWVTSTASGYNTIGYDSSVINQLSDETLLYTAPPRKPESATPNFCKDCGKGLLGKDHIHTCSPQVKRQWVGLTDEDKELLITLHAPPIHPDFSDDDSFDDLLSKHEAKLKELNAAPTAQMGKEK